MDKCDDNEGDICKVHENVASICDSNFNANIQIRPKYSRLVELIRE